jgi:hypothetical protein
MMIDVAQAMEPIKQTGAMQKFTSPAGDCFGREQS